MKFGPLIEYNMQNNFLEKSYTKCGGEPILRPFPKKSLYQYSKAFYSLSLLDAKLRTIKIY